MIHTLYILYYALPTIRTLQNATYFTTRYVLHGHYHTHHIVCTSLHATLYPLYWLYYMLYDTFDARTDDIICTTVLTLLHAIWYIRHTDWWQYRLAAETADEMDTWLREITAAVGPYMCPYMCPYMYPYMYPYMCPYMYPYMCPYMSLYVPLNVSSNVFLYVSLFITFWLLRL